MVKGIMSSYETNLVYLTKLKPINNYLAFSIMNDELKKHIEGVLSCTFWKAVRKPVSKACLEQVSAYFKISMFDLDFPEDMFDEIKSVIVGYVSENLKFEKNYKNKLKNQCYLLIPITETRSDWYSLYKALARIKDIYLRVVSHGVNLILVDNRTKFQSYLVPSMLEEAEYVALRNDCSGINELIEADFIMQFEIIIGFYNKNFIFNLESKNFLFISYDKKQLLEFEDSSIEVYDEISF